MSLTLSPQQDKAILSWRDWYRDLPEAQESLRHVYNPATDEQTVERVVDRGLDKAPFFLLEGFAGTGKSTVLPFLVEATGLSPSQIVFCSPTGKAAKVMTKKLRAESMNANATTIHKAIYRPKAMKAYQIEQELFRAQADFKNAQSSGDGTLIRELARKVKQWEKDLERAYDENSPKFQLDPETPSMRGAHLIVVDECSMVDANMAEDLRSFGVPILAIGDPGQLPPVDPSGPGFCNRIADAALTEIHRQAADNPIIWASMLIRNGEDVPYGSHGGGLLNVIEPKDDDKTFDLDLDAQIIVGTHEKRWQITRKLRKLSGFGGDGPCAGEMMIVTKNSQKHPGLVNGTMAIVDKDVGRLSDGSITFNMGINDEEGRSFQLRCLQATLEEHYRGKNNPTAPKRDVFRARQDPNVHEIDYAYAITCHKSQGSQWDEVVVHDQSRSFRADASRWLYTAVTRAAERLTLVM
ncbi:putative DNA helicase [Mesorhizobium phage Cp1R7A-A1]|nr:putative DNA helicase [Mesorhizobium phage Cp1R7A-A1]